MNFPRVRIAGTGIICALGNGRSQVVKAIVDAKTGLSPLGRFKVPHIPPLPVGACPDLSDDPHPSHTIELARGASDQAMASSNLSPDAIVIGVTTGGMALTETLFKQACKKSDAYQYHGIGTVAQDLAGRFKCKGPVLTVSTACSSGTCAIALAVAMIQSGRYQRILAGGVDSLCRLTYYGFKSLQLIDPKGARPLDKDRKGMSVAEGAGMLLLEAAAEKCDGVEILGTGLSCDAHHPAQPHPKGEGAFAAMQYALFHANLKIDQIDYVNLHGTGTADNDRAESLAIHRLFNNVLPPLSSIKGATGHTLAASGAIEAVIAALCMDEGIVPANIGCQTPDPSLNVVPVMTPLRQPINTVLSNSFGFGGNNATVVIGRHRGVIQKSCNGLLPQSPLSAIGWSAITGAGFTQDTVENMSTELGCKGKIDSRKLCQNLSPSVIRRVKRLSQMGLALLTYMQMSSDIPSPESIFFGTGWGSLSETHDFLEGLFESDEKFASPTDFIGSVHNAASGQVALMAQSKGANLTLSGGDYSFEQALMSAQLLADENIPVMVLGADEAHEKLSPLFDPSVVRDPYLSDGGGALMLSRTAEPNFPTIALTYFANHFDESLPDLESLVTALGGARQIRSKYGLIMAGLPAAQRAESQKQLDQFIASTGYHGDVMDYRRRTGEYATAAAVAVVFAVSKMHHAKAGCACSGSGTTWPQNKAVLILGLGSVITAIEVASP